MTVTSAVICRVASAVRPVVPLAIRMAGRDATAEIARRSALVLAPHPDDETLGCGATIALKRAAGARVQVLVATDGGSGSQSAVMSAGELGALRRAEVVGACQVVGVATEDVSVLDHPDGSVADAEDAMVAQPAHLLASTRPDEVFVTSPADPHPDHAAYPIWQWPLLRPWLVVPDTGDGTTRIGPAWRTRPILVRTGERLATKRRAMQVHRSQLDNLTGEAGWRTLDPGSSGISSAHEVFFSVRRPRDAQQ